MAACFEALAMRSSGMGYRQIGAAQGVDVATAHRRVTDAIKANGAKDAETERSLDLERLDAYLLVVHERLRQGDVKALEVALRVMDRRAKLLGLDAPTVTKAEVTNRDAMDVELEDIVRKVREKADREEG